MELAINKEKYLSFETCAEILDSYRQQGSKIVLCNGVFDLLHPGHIAHLQAAKAMGDLLVISLTATPYVNRGPGRPIFSDELRLSSLAALACVDYVILTPKVTALEVIEKVRPHIYCKGDEYADASKDVTQNIDKEVAQVRAYGGDVRYTNEITFSSTRLINNYLDVVPSELKDYVKDLTQQYSYEQIADAVEAMQLLKVLVLGDVIIDEFVHCTVQGLTSKGRAPSTRFVKKEQHLGGIFAIARHLESFANSVTVASAIGNEPDVHRSIANQIKGSIDLNLQYAEGYSTVTKCRYIEQQGTTKGYTQLFAINSIDEEGLAPQERQKLLDSLEKSIKSYDLVVLADYGHGLIDSSMMELIQSQAPFLAVNCQTNSANYGYNLISKYRRADTFCIDEQELRLAFSNRYGDRNELLKRLQSHLGAQQGWLTLAASGSLAIQANGELVMTPAMTQQVKDTTGAGDAFFALASLSAKLDLPLKLGSFLGNMAGAIAANVLGNEKPVAKPRLLKFAKTICTF
ncbi:PfkB family carbohydrate kinase [Coleofasciculus sp. H7-2]|uniref:PfkB family carbohydrate kinase n=1 Tax=Coleofasciculus sp. H7-2 TaxID=3351545 RepID=UPI00366D2E94